MVLILTITLAVAIPMFNSAQTYSKQKACESQMSAIFQAEEAYRTKNRAYVADLTSAGLNMPNGLPVCPLGTAAYTAAVSGSGASQTITIRCNNTGAHVASLKWITSDGSTFTSQ